VVRTGGGGGYGEPKERSRDQKKQDLLNNFTGNIS
jgi:N-methylhydantoinase B/oxoprolinase/acetone carboxylase alpha subunit